MKRQNTDQQNVENHITRVDSELRGMVALAQKLLHESSSSNSPLLAASTAQTPTLREQCEFPLPPPSETAFSPLSPPPPPPPSSFDSPPPPPPPLVSPGVDIRAPSVPLPSTPSPPPLPIPLHVPIQMLLQQSPAMPAAPDASPTVDIAPPPAQYTSDPVAIQSVLYSLRKLKG